MKAIHVNEFGAPSVLKLAEVSPPSVSSPSHVLIAVSFAGVNPVDCYIRSGAYASRPPLPYTPGKDAAGVVLAVGADVRHVRPGDRVWTYGSLSGTYAQVVLCEGWQVLPLPDSLTDEEGASLGTPFATAYRALFARGGVKAKPDCSSDASEVVFIHGASGAVGLAAVQLATLTGCHVIASAGSDEGAALCRAAGAADVVDHRQWQTPGAQLELPLQPTLIVEMLASSNLARDLAAIAPGGRIVIVGSRGPIEIDPRAAMQKEVDIRGVMLSRATHAEREEMGEHVCAGLRAGTLRALPVHVLQLDQAAEAHERTLARVVPGQGRMVLRVPPNESVVA